MFRPVTLSFRPSPQALELDSKYVKAWAKKGDIEFFMKEYHKALDSYKMVGPAADAPKAPSLAHERFQPLPRTMIQPSPRFRVHLLLEFW